MVLLAAAHKLISFNSNYMRTSPGLYAYTGFASERKNLSPFTKDFRGEGHLSDFTSFCRCVSHRTN